MPIFSGDALGIGVGMDGKDLGMSFRTGRVRVNVQLAEIAAERLVAFHVKRLIAKEQDLMLRQRQVQFLDLAVLSGLASVKPATSAPIRGVTGMTLMVW